MTDKERIDVCKSLIETLKRIINGAKLPISERADACQKAIQIFCDSGSQHADNMHHLENA